MKGLVDAADDDVDAEVNLCLLVPLLQFELYTKNASKEKQKAGEEEEEKRGKMNVTKMKKTFLSLSLSLRFHKTSNDLQTP